jgi:cytochrome b subunit of formate dehydrogenase
VRIRRTDYGTIILHWLLAGATIVAFITGLRIATEAPDHEWLNKIDWVLPRAHVWTWHMPAAIVLVGVAVAYTIYVMRSGLSRRVAMDKIRLRGLFGRPQARKGSISILLHWLLFLAMLALIVSGGLLFFGVESGHLTMQIHWYATWIVPVFILLHVLTHYSIGGTSQLFRVIRPSALPPPPPKLDAVELLTMLVEQTERLEESEVPVRAAPPSAPTASPAMKRPDGIRTRGEPQGSGGGRRGPGKTNSRRRNATFQSNPFVVAIAVAITAGSAVVAADYFAEDSLTIHRIASADTPTLDGDTSDHIWRTVAPHEVMTNQGGNFDGTGESRVEIRAVHDGTWAYFLFTWDDPTRSLKQLPMVKKADGWYLMHNGYEVGDEHDYNEDKFSVLFTTLDVTLAGDRTFHASPQPMSDKPATMSGRGIHYTPGTDVYADVWQWKATNGGPTGWLDDDHFGPPAEPTPEQVSNTVPYRGGFAPDPGNANYKDNFVLDTEAMKLGNRGVRPLRLPKDVVAMTAAMGDISLDPNMGESENARWFLMEADSVPYSAEADARIPVGTVLPGVVLSGDYSGDRADVRCAARWASGRWALEVARKLDTGSKYDIPLKSGVYMRVSAFDHSQIRHTRHVRPIRLEVE